MPATNSAGPSPPKASKGSKDPKAASKKPPRATLEQKLQILDYYHKSGRPQSETVERFRSEVAISTSTFNEWLKNEDEYRSRYRDSDSQFEKHARRKVTYKYDKINRAMDLLVQQRLASGEEITEPILRNYWQIYAHQYGVENPKRLVGFSHGWLSQFKKRHGLCRSKTSHGGDLTSSNNEKLLADPTSEEESAGHEAANIARSKDTLSPPTDPSEGQGLFRPQQTLSFPQNISYLPSESSRSTSADRSRSQTRSQTHILPNLAADHVVSDSAGTLESAESLESAMQLSLNTRKQFSAHDIERFLVDVADRFFQDHQYDYPQTMHLYEEFKSSFHSERLISLRSSQENATSHLNETLGSRSSQSHIQTHTQSHLQPHTQSHLQPRAQSRLQPHMQQMGAHSQQNIGAHPSQQIGAHPSQQIGAHPSQQIGAHSSQQLATSQAPHTRRNMGRLQDNSLMSAHSRRDIRGPRSSSRSRSRGPSLGPSSLSGPGVGQTPEEPLNSLVMDRSRHPPRPQQMQHAYRTEETEPVDVSQPMDNLFIRQTSVKQRSYTSEQQWQDSESRKIWEQNKLMLS